MLNSINKVNKQSSTRTNAIDDKSNVNNVTNTAYENSLFKHT